MARSKVLPKFSPAKEPPSAPHLRVGRDGERIAEGFLLRNGYEIRGRNVRVGHDEIDILAFDPVDQVLVFAEVKSLSRRGGDFPPEMHAGWKKWKKLRRAAATWAAENDFEGGYRFDLLCVEAGEVTKHWKEVGTD